jgi:hypothetical protein
MRHNRHNKSTRHGHSMPVALSLQVAAWFCAPGTKLPRSMPAGRLTRDFRPLSPSETIESDKSQGLNVLIGAGDGAV